MRGRATRCGSIAGLPEVRFWGRAGQSTSPPRGMRAHLARFGILDAIHSQLKVGEPKRAQVEASGGDDYLRGEQGRRPSLHERQACAARGA